MKIFDFDKPFTGKINPLNILYKTFKPGEVYLDEEGLMFIVKKKENNSLYKITLPSLVLYQTGQAIIVCRLKV